MPDSERCGIRSLPVGMIRRFLLMKAYHVAVIPGDGIGRDVTNEAIKVLNAVAQKDGSFRFAFTEFPWGCEYYLKTGKMMDDDGMDVLKKFDAIFLGAVGYPDVPDHISLRDLLIKIRRGFDQYVNLRPIKLLKGADSVLKDVSPEDIDMLFVRENTEGEYCGLGSWEGEGTEDERVTQLSVFTRKGTERIIRYAFELARKNNTSCTSITKGNALNYSMVFWDKVFSEVAKEYPDVPTAQYMVDAASMFMVKDPKRFGVVVASNLFGDILTDLGAAISGGIGLAAGANINPEGNYPSMFEPIHGSAPDIAGKGIANPLASIWTAAMMLDHFGYGQYAQEVVDAIETLLVERKVGTPDLNGTATTRQVGDEIVRILSAR